MQIYQDYNRGVPDVGWFIPAGFYETMDEYDARGREILDYTKDWTILDVKRLVTKFWIPRTTYRSYQQWIANQIIPRMNLLNPTKTMCDENKRQFIIGWLIDVGWDPLHRWYCEPPDEAAEDVKYVMNGIWDKFNHQTYPQIKNQYMSLFNINAHRIIQFIDMIDRVSHFNPHEDMDKFLLDREKRMIAHLAWLVKTDSRVYDHFRKILFKQVDHNIGMAMAINDPLMREEERLRRDLMLSTQPKRGCDEFRVEGHNRLRDSIVGEYVPAINQAEARNGIFQYYMEENNYMEEYLLIKFAKYLDHPSEAVSVVKKINTLPHAVTDHLVKLYGNCDIEVFATMIEMAITTFEKHRRKPRYSEKDAISLTIQMLTSTHKTVMRIQNRVNTTSGESVVTSNDINLAGAIRVIMSDPDAKREFYRITRAFGSQDPKHNDKIAEMLIELAVNTIAKNQVNREFDRKDPQSILLRKEQPRNPRNHVEGFFESMGYAGEMGNDHFDVVTNGNSEDGHADRKKISLSMERELAKRDETISTNLRRQLMRNANVGGLNAAMHQYLGELDTKRSNPGGKRNRDLAKEKRRAMEQKRDRQDLDEMIKRYDIDDIVSSKAPSVSLANATEEELYELTNALTDTGYQYIRDLLRNFDLEAPDEYDDPEDYRELVRERNELLRTNLEEILNTADPDYIINGIGNPGDFVPDDTSMTASMFTRYINAMDIDELLAFINENIDEDSQQQLLQLVKAGYTPDQIKDVILDNIDAFVDVDADDDEEILRDDQLDYLAALVEKFDSMNRQEISEFAQDSLEEEDVKVVERMLKHKPLKDVREYIVDLLFHEYEPAEEKIPENQNLSYLFDIADSKASERTEDDTDIRSALLRSLSIQDDGVGEYEEDLSRSKSIKSLSKEREDFYYWMIDSVYGVNEDALLDALTHMNTIEFSNFKRNLRQKIASGEIELIDEEDERDDEDLNQFDPEIRNIIQKMRMSHPSSVTYDADDEREEEDEHPIHFHRG